MSETYHANSATFELPKRLKDKTVHMFTLTDDGPNEFSMVISHADVNPDEELEDFGNRLLAEFGRALPRFQLRGMSEREIDGRPAMELAYSWRNDGHFMHQRQIIVFVQGPKEGTVQAMMIGGTCLNAFTDEWNAALDEFLGTVKLRNPVAARRAPPPAVLKVVNPSGLPIVFAYSERRRMLHVYPNASEACRRTDSREVARDAWAFFDGDGEPLAYHFENGALPATQWDKPGTYTLAPGPADGPRLRDQLHHVALMYTSGDDHRFADVDDLRRHLARVVSAPGT